MGTAIEPAAFDTLQTMYDEFLKAECLPQRDAMELIHEAELTDAQRKWLSDFYIAWDQAEKAERAFIASRVINDEWDYGGDDTVRAYVYLDSYGIEITEDDKLYLQIENHEWVMDNTPSNLATLERELFNWVYPEEFTGEEE